MQSKIVKAITIFTVAVLSAAILANSMTKPLGHDEQMYCTGAALLARGEMIYRDFSYVAQMPYHPLLCAALFKILDTTHYLLVVRLLSVVCDVLIVVCIVAIYQHIFSGFNISAMILGLSGAVLYLFNPFVSYANGFAWNHDIVILLVVASFWLFISTDFKDKSRYWKIALMGGLLTLATCMRITTALAELVFFVFLLVRPSEPIKARLKTVLAFLIASAVVLIWPVWILITSARAFYLNLFWIPMLNSEWLHQAGLVYNKSHLIFLAFTTPGYPLLIVIAIFLYLMLVLKRRKLAASNVINLLLGLVLPLIFCVIAVIVPVMWTQYLAMPVPFFVISFAYPLLYLQRLGDGTGKGFKAIRGLIVGCALASMLLYPVVLYKIPELLAPQGWVPNRVHRISKDIAEKTEGSKLILTLGPLYALEGSCDIYTELSAGVFVYRIADFLSPSDYRIAHAVGAKTLEQLIEESPPAAVVLGVEPKPLEIPLFMATKPNQQGWEAEVYDDGPTAYFRR
ncbi:MAG: hypothetical protein ACYSR5_02145 [Planctomycetota bacterium]|jgi:hypothetical protein